MASSSPQIKKSRFVKNQPLENEEMEQRLVDIKKKLQNYDLEMPRTKDERIDDCFDVMLIDSDKRFAQELQIIERGLRGTALMAKLLRKGYDRQARECYRVMKGKTVKKGECVFYQGDIADNFYILVRGKLHVLTLKDSDTLEKDKKSHSQQDLNNIQAYVTSLQTKKQMHNSSQKDGQEDNAMLQSSPLTSPILTSQHSHHKSNPGITKIQSNNEKLLINQIGFNNSSNISQFDSPIRLTRRSIIETIDEQMLQFQIQLQLQQQQQFIQASQNELDLGIQEDEGSQTSRSRAVSVHLLRSFKDNHYNKVKNILPLLPGNMQIEDILQPSALFSNGIYLYSNANMIKEGDSFGEAGLIMKRPRTATILAGEDSQLAVISRSEYNLILKEIQNRKMLKKIGLLIENMEPGIPFQTASRLAFALFKLTLSYDQPVFQQGDSPGYLYFLKEGEVQISFNSKEIADPMSVPLSEDEINIRRHGAQKTKQTTISCIGNGTFFGEEEIMHNLPTRIYTARVRSSVAKIYRIKEAEFRFLLSQSSSLKDFFHRRLENKDKWRGNQQDQAILKESILFRRNIKQSKKQGGGYNSDQIVNGVDDIDKIIAFCQEKQIIQQKITKDENIQGNKEKEIDKDIVLHINNGQDNTDNINSSNRIDSSVKNTTEQSMKSERSLKIIENYEKQELDVQINIQNGVSRHPSMLIRDKSKEAIRIYAGEYGSGVEPQMIQIEKTPQQMNTQLHYLLSKQVQYDHLTSKRPQSASEVFTSSNFITTANKANRHLIKLQNKGKQISEEMITNGIVFVDEYREKVRERLQKFQRILHQRRLKKTRVLEKMKKTEEERNGVRKEEQEGQFFKQIQGSSIPSRFADNQKERRQEYSQETQINKMVLLGTTADEKIVLQKNNQRSSSPQMDRFHQIKENQAVGGVITKFGTVSSRSSPQKLKSNSPRQQLKSAGEINGVKVIKSTQNFGKKLSQNNSSNNSNGLQEQNTIINRDSDKPSHGLKRNSNQALFFYENDININPSKVLLMNKAKEQILSQKSSLSYKKAHIQKLIITQTLAQSLKQFQQPKSTPQKNGNSGIQDEEEDEEGNQLGPTKNNKILFKSIKIPIQNQPLSQSSSTRHPSPTLQAIQSPIASATLEYQTEGLNGKNRSFSTNNLRPQTASQQRQTQTIGNQQLESYFVRGPRGSQNNSFNRCLKSTTNEISSKLIGSSDGLLQLQSQEKQRADSKGNIINYSSSEVHSQDDNNNGTSKRRLSAAIDQYLTTKTFNKPSSTSFSQLQQKPSQQSSFRQPSNSLSALFKQQVPINSICYPQETPSDINLNNINRTDITKVDLEKMILDWNELRKSNQTKNHISSWKNIVQIGCSSPAGRILPQSARALNNNNSSLGLNFNSGGSTKRDRSTTPQTTPRTSPRVVNLVFPKNQQVQTIRFQRDIGLKQIGNISSLIAHQ